MASTAEAVLFANLAYLGPEANWTNVQLPNGWIYLRKSDPNDHNYFGVSFENLQTGEIVIANRGSVGSDWTHTDLAIAAGELGLTTTPPAAFSDALAFAQAVMSQYSATDYVSVGHSLGGAETEYQAAELGITGVTFAAPGVKWAVGNETGNVTNYVFEDEPIGTLGQHVGSVVALKATLPDAVFDQDVYGDIGLHGLSNYLEYFGASGAGTDSVFDVTDSVLSLLGFSNQLQTNNANAVITYDDPLGTVYTVKFDSSGLGFILDTETPAGTSQITTYSDDGSSTTKYYTGPDGTGTLTKTDVENKDGTSQITTYNSAGSTTTTYAGPNGTGIITSVDLEIATSSVVQTPSQLVYDYTGTAFSGSVVYNTGAMPYGIATDVILHANNGLTFIDPPVANPNSISSSLFIDNTYQVTGWNMQVYLVVAGIGSMAGIGAIVGGPDGTGGIAAGETYYPLVPSDSPFYFAPYPSTPTDASWSIVSITPGESVTPRIGETQSLLDLLDNPTLTAQGPLQTLTVNGPGTVELTGVATISKVTVNVGGNFLLQNGTLNTDPITVDSGGSISGYGTITGDETVYGTITAGSGTLDITGNIGGSGALTFVSGGSLLLEGTVATTGNVLFNAPTETLLLGASADVLAPLSGFGAGDAIGLEGDQVTGASYNANTQLLTITGGSGVSFPLALAGSYQPGNFGVANGQVVFEQVTCFCRGTMILTERGDVPVEDLLVGDRVKTLAGAVKPIVWIGFGRDLVTRANKLARPIIVRRDALADGVPYRDLYLTHGHALYLDGVLIPVENLVNHRSIAWDDSARFVEYYHIELADHDVVQGNGAPAETYYDANNRASFHNARPGSAPGGAMPTYAPVLTGGAAVDHVWTALFARSGGRPAIDTTDDPDLHLVVDGRRLDPAAAEGCAYRFALDAPPTAALSLCSRSGVPSLLGITAHDHRRLGVALRRIELSQPGVVTNLEHDAPLFSEGGCHSAEQGYCWTDGELTLPVRLFEHLAGECTLTVHIERPGMRYPVLPAIAAAA